jgi:hypothetical protein
MRASARITRWLLTGFALALPIALADPARAVCNSNQFGLPLHLSANSNPAQVVIGDFNEDGISDLAAAVSRLAAASGAGAYVSVYIGTGSSGVGNGGFLAPVDYPTGNACFGIVVGDFNSDGIQDLATSNYGGNNVSILRGQGAGGVGNGTFAAAANYPAGPGAWHLATGDFDEDGITDLAVSNNSAPGVTILRGQGSGGVGDGTFVFQSSHILTNTATDIRVADVNEDGILDVLVAVQYSGKIAVLKGLGAGGVGNGSFANVVQFTAGIEPFSFDVADLDSDGILDLAVGNSNSGGVQFLRGNGAGGVGDGTFAAPVEVATGNIGSVRAADINQDGILDLVSTRSIASGTHPLLVSIGNGNGTFAAPELHPVGQIPVGLAVGNFDGSPKLDVAVCTYTGNTVAVLLGVCGPLGPPAITRVRDVPNDQGGKVFVTWTASAYDFVGGPVTSYRVWRRIPAELALLRQAAGATASLRTRRLEGTDPKAAAITYWEAAATLPAQRLEGYGYTASTPQDSLAGSNPYTAFFITAATSDIDVFYDSAVDSGYSVDNLPPGAPQNASATLQAQQVHLLWDSNQEADLALYRIHRGTSSGFVPSPANLIASVTEPEYFDPASPALYYKLIAVDVHGNPSAATLAVIAGPTAIAVSASDPVLADDGSVELAWHVAEPVTVDIERSSGVGWDVRTTLTADARGTIRWTDRELTAGTSYEYRLRLPGDTWAGTVSIHVPAFTFALDGVTPNPARSGSFGIRFRLADRAPATLEIVDVGGRKVMESRVDPLGPGEHVFAVDRVQRLPAGVYLVRLTSGTRLATTKAVLLQ